MAQKKVERAARRAEYEEQSGAAGKLQAVLRGRLGRRRAHQARIDEQNNLKRAATKLQCAVRGRIARRQRTFAAVALAAQAELRAKEDVSKLYWGDSEEEAEREAKLKKDFLRLQATASGAVQQYSWEEWRWRWLEMRSVRPPALDFVPAGSSRPGALPRSGRVAGTDGAIDPSGALPSHGRGGAGDRGRDRGDGRPEARLAPAALEQVRTHTLLTLLQLFC